MERLVGPNHAEWASKLKGELEKRGLWEVVEPGNNATTDRSTKLTLTERQQLERANRAIIETLEPHVMRDVLLSAPPSNLWKVLQERYHAKPFGSVMDKAFEWLDFRLEDDHTPLVDHFLRMERLAHSLELMGMSIPEDVQVMQLLRSLQGSSRYAGVLKDFRRLPAAPSKAFVMEKLMRSTESSTLDVQSTAQEPVNSRAPSPAGSAAGSSGDLSPSWSWQTTKPVSPNHSSSQDFSSGMMSAFARAMHLSSADSFEQVRPALSPKRVDAEEPESKAEPSHCCCSCNHGQLKP